MIHNHATPLCQLGPSPPPQRPPACPAPPQQIHHRRLAPFICLCESCADAAWAQSPGGSIPCLGSIPWVLQQLPYDRQVPVGAGDVQARVCSRSGWIDLNTRVPQ